MKICTKCKGTKTLEEFSNAKERKDGKYPWCKVCHKARKATIYTKEELAVFTKAARIARQLNGKGAKYEKEKRETDVNWKLRCYLRTRVYQALKGTNKSIHTSELLGCTTDELRSHLQSLFTKGMTWENQGEWHIDHIKPCVSFDLTDPEQQKACFHFSNLQPLWAMDNWLKGTK